MKIEKASTLVTGTADYFNRISVDHLPDRLGGYIGRIWLCREPAQGGLGFHHG
ncbi:MAG TPA: hypothetical protein VMT29_08070 [Steroidobacteraceae bacterium]|nr:hypothetical protein [Steroidobacteraceae bacterium]